MKYLVCALVMALLIISPTLAQPAPGGSVVTDLDQPLRLRQYPNTISQVLDLIPPGSPLILLGRSADNLWLNVQTPTNTVGWVFAEHVVLNVDIYALEVLALAPRIAYDEVVRNVTPHTREIFARGQERGNHANIFAKVGDSITANPFVFAPIGWNDYDLGEFDHLQPVIDQFNEAYLPDGSNAFSRESRAALSGWTAATVLDIDHADPAACSPGETPLDCEYRITRPSIALIMLGTNDAGYIPAVNYESNMRRIIERSLELSIIPVISTIPDRGDVEARVNEFNGILERLTVAYDIPLWDYNRAMRALPNRGLSADNVHPSLPPTGYEGVAAFYPENLNYGYVIRNLTALHVLDRVWREAILPPPPDATPTASAGRAPTIN